MIEHPDITHAMRTGYDRETWRNLPNVYLTHKTENVVYDYYGDIIDLANDHYVVIPTGYKILHRNLQRYLEERKGFEFNYYFGDGEDGD